jgi:hypothetical protein
MRLLPVVLIGAATAGWAAWLAVTPAVARAASGGTAVWAAAVTYRAGAVICHQRDERSFHVAGVRMPVCARCFGLYAGAAAGALAVLGWMLTRRRRLARDWRLPLGRWRWLVAASAIPTAAAWAGEHAAGLAVSGIARAIAALPLGAAVAAIAALWSGGASFDDTAPGSALH